MEAEDLGGAAGAGEEPVGLPQHGEDVVAFHGLQAGLARGRWGARAIGELAARRR